MGCDVSSEGDDDCRRRIIGVSAAVRSHHHHIVSLTSSTYNILTTPRAYSIEAIKPSPAVVVGAMPPPQQSPEPEEVINSWELMADLLDPSTPAKPGHRKMFDEMPKRVL
jgi:glutaredoxin domain-containing cysteine-rich protein 1